MGQEPEDFRISNPRFGNDGFTNKDDLRRFLHRGERDTLKEPLGYFTINKIVEFMTQLRFKAEELYSVRGWLAKDKRRELPLPWEEAWKIFRETDDGNPPQTVITMIAEHTLPRLQLLLNNMRKVLHRERQSVPLSQVRQLDLQCMRWLTRQPGQTMGDKAGSRQRIMAVVRQETYDNLENRVFKAFINKCRLVATDYKKQYDHHQWSNSTRIKAIKALIAFCTTAVRMPEFQAIGRLTTMPAPNYVLQYDPLYSEVWRCYGMLLKQSRLIEDVWAYRHRLVAEFVRFSIELQLQNTPNLQPIFRNDLWIDFFPEKGQFLRHTVWNNLFIAASADFPGDTLQITENSHKDSMLSWRWNQLSTKYFSMSYLYGDFAGNKLRPRSLNEHLVCFAENGKASANNPVRTMWCDKEDLQENMVKLYKVITSSGRPS